MHVEKVHHTSRMLRCMVVQAGGEGLLTVRDETGNTPAQLAVSKGHRPLGVYLADWRRWGLTSRKVVWWADQALDTELMGMTTTPSPHK